MVKLDLQKKGSVCMCILVGVCACIFSVVGILACVSCFDANGINSFKNNQYMSKEEVEKKLVAVNNTEISDDSTTKKNTQEEIEEQLNEEVDKQLDELNMHLFEEFIASLDSEQYKLFGSSGFVDKVKSVLSGNFAGGSDSFLKALLNLLFGEMINFLPTLASIIVVAVLCGLLSNMRPNFLSKGMGEVIYFVCYAVIILLMSTAIVQLMDVARSTMKMMQNQMNVVFPVILTLMAGVGGVVSVKVYQPAVAVLSGVVLNVIIMVIFPIFIISLVLGVTSNLSGNVKLNKLNDFFKTLSNWIIGIVFTVFLAFLSIQGITASTYDGISIRAAKYAVSNSIPIVGGYLKEGFDLIVSSSVLIKNSIGVSGLLLLIATVAVPFVKLLIFMLGLKITAGIVEPITDSRIATFISSTSKSLTMLIVSIVCVAFMYFITVMLLICSSNAFY